MKGIRKEHNEMGMLGGQTKWVWKGYKRDGWEGRMDGYDEGELSRIMGKS